MPSCQKVRAPKPFNFGNGFQTLRSRLVTNYEETTLHDFAPSVRVRSSPKIAADWRKRDKEEEGEVQAREKEAGDANFSV